MTSEKRVRTTETRLVVLAATAAVSCLAVLAASGELTARAAAAGAAAAAALAGLAAAPTGAGRPSHRAPAGVIAAPRELRTVKRLLLVVLAGGLAVYLGAGGTFAGFSAETTNPGNSAASGTLTMSNQVNSNTACLSINGTLNVNSSCDAAFALTNLAPGVFKSTYTAKITVTNTGSLDAQKLWLWAPPNTTATLTSGITSGQNVTSLSVDSLPANVVAGQSVVVKSGFNSQQFTVSAPASKGATTVSVAAQTATANFPAGTSSVTVVDCYDQKTTTAPPGSPPGTTKGTDLNFNSTAGNPFCGTLLLYVQEITGESDGNPSTHNYCWVGASYGDSSGMCRAPIAVTLSSAVNGTGVTSLPVTALNGNVRSGDQIVLSSGASQQTVTASANAYVGATAIPINAANLNFPSGTSVVDSTTLGSLNADTTDTITNFDTLHNGGVGPIELAPVVGNGTLQTSGQTVELAAGASRTFLVGVYFPLPTGINQNGLQGLSSTFGLTWHIDQTG